MISLPSLPSHVHPTHLPSRPSQNQILDAAAIDASNSGSKGRARGARPNPRPVADLYAFGATIGRGGFAEVRRAKHMETGVEYAMKVIKLPSRHKRAFKQEIFYEIGLLSKMDSPYVIKLREFFVESERIIMVTELLEGGDLFDAVVASGHYDEHMAKKVFRRILLGVQYLHEVGVTHCDLKLENLLLASKTDLDSVKICDLGLAKKASARSSSLPSGTPEYISPEVLEANLMADAAEGRGSLPQVSLFSFSLYLAIRLTPCFVYSYRRTGPRWTTGRAACFSSCYWPGTPRSRTRTSTRCTS